jgi:hypothetical protein
VLQSGTNACRAINYIDVIIANCLPEFVPKQVLATLAGSRLPDADSLPKDVVMEHVSLSYSRGRRGEECHNHPVRQRLERTRLRRGSCSVSVVQLIESPV